VGELASFLVIYSLCHLALEAPLTFTVESLLRVYLSFFAVAPPLYLTGAVLLAIRHSLSGQFFNACSGAYPNHHYLGMCAVICCHRHPPNNEYSTF